MASRLGSAGGLEAAGSAGSQARAEGLGSSAQLLLAVEGHGGRVCCCKPALQLSRTCLAHNRRFQAQGGKQGKCFCGPSMPGAGHHHTWLCARHPRDWAADAGSEGHRALPAEELQARPRAAGRPSQLWRRHRAPRRLVGGCGAPAARGRAGCCRKNLLAYLALLLQPRHARPCPC